MPRRSSTWRALRARVRTVAAGHRPQGIAGAGRTVYVANAADGALTLLSAAAGKLNEATLSAASAASVAALMMRLDSVVIVVFSLVHVLIC